MFDNSDDHAAAAASAANIIDKLATEKSVFHVRTGAVVATHKVIIAQPSSAYSERTEFSQCHSVRFTPHKYRVRLCARIC